MKAVIGKAIIEVAFDLDGPSADRPFLRITASGIMFDTAYFESVAMATSAMERIAEEMNPKGAEEMLKEILLALNGGSTPDKKKKKHKKKEKKDGHAR